MAQQEDKVYSVAKRFNRSTVSPYNNSLAFIDNEDAEGQLTVSPNGFATCRETFHGQNSSRMNDILFAHGVGVGKNVLLFVNQFEKRMGHTLLTEGGPTNVKNVSWFKPADFWRRNPMRRSLFTILLRNGINFKPRSKNFDQTLYGHIYTSGTRAAVERFLQGYTWYTGNSRGWYQQFSSGNYSNLDKLLTKRPVDEAQLLKFACKKLGLSRTQLITAFRANKAEKTLEAESKETVKPKRPEPLPVTASKAMRKPKAKPRTKKTAVSVRTTVARRRREKAATSSITATA